MENENENDQSKDKYLGFFTPRVDPQSQVFCCCSITIGNQFISIILLLISCIYFYNALYSIKSVITQLILCFVYGASGFFLLLSTLSQNYIQVKISYVLYGINFFIKFILYSLLFLIEIIYIFIDTKYVKAMFPALLGGIIELCFMSYFLYVMYCYLIITKFNSLNKIGDEYQQLIKDSNEKIQESI